ncbi:MAG: hypothetical protein HXY23_09960 [Parvularculaceae bacterium]|jgi:hypothetical protein|nr:hypothetical protein [Parvularculaceae bacterium]
MTAAPVRFVAGKTQEVAEPFELVAHGEPLELADHVFHVFRDFVAAGAESLFL